MFWRVPSTGKHWQDNKGAPNRELFKSLVRSGEVEGLLAFDSGVPVGWCSLGPREAFAYLSRARKIGPPPGPRTWSVTCFFIERQSRRRGIASLLLQSAVDYARQRGASWLEGYPSDLPDHKIAPDAFVHTGTSALFRANGFEAVAAAGKKMLYRRKLAIGERASAGKD